MRGVATGAWTTLLLALAVLTVAAAEDLPRKASGGSRADEHYPGVVVLYDSMRDAQERRVRLIVTHPQQPHTRLPTIFLVGWLSCDTVEAPPGTTEATQLVMQHLAQLPGFATVRMDKAGVGDSEGDCASTDFVTELSEYRYAIRRIMNYPFVDSSQLFLFGVSNGGGFAPLLAADTAVKGYVVDGGWIKTWYEHMLEIERRRLVLEGHPAAQINTLMKSVAALYSDFLLNRVSPAQIFATRPELRMLWTGDAGHQYGRPVSYYQQLQDLDLTAAWANVKVPVLVLHGEHDWIMTREDLEIMASLVNRNSPGAAQFVELPDTGHTFEHYGSRAEAFSGKALPFDPKIAERIGEWFQRHIPPHS